MDNENKEELEKKKEDTQNVSASQEEPKLEKTNTEEIKEEPKKEEAEVDSEEYYDDIDYQQKEEAEKVKAKTRSV